MVNEQTGENMMYLETVDDFEYALQSYLAKENAEAVHEYRLRISDNTETPKMPFITMVMAHFVGEAEGMEREKAIGPLLNAIQRMEHDGIWIGEVNIGTIAEKAKLSYAFLEKALKGMKTDEYEELLKKELAG
jgi:hypothetical protein